MKDEYFFNKFQNYLKDFDEEAYELIWMYFCSNTYYYEFKHHSPLTSYLTLPTIETIKRNVVDFFKNSKRTIVDIQTAHLIVKNRLIPPEYLEWITSEDTRLIYWLEKKISYLNGLYYLLDPIPVPKSELYINTIKYYENQKEYITLPPTPKKYIKLGGNIILTPYYNMVLFNKTPSFTIESLKYKLNYRNRDKQAKIFELEHIRSEWNRIKTPDNLTSWVKKDNTEQLNWAASYLLKKQPSNIFIKNIDHIDNYNFILICFDQYRYSHPIERQFFIEKMKKTWSQKKFRDAGKTKKPHHLPLTKTTITQLQKLTKLMNMKENQIIELLVDEAFRNEVMINGKEIF